MMFIQAMTLATLISARGLQVRNNVEESFLASADKPAPTANQIGSMTLMRGDKIDYDNYQDMLDIVWVAETCANQKYDYTKNPTEWYKLLAANLNYFGLVTGGFEWHEQHDHQVGFTMDMEMIAVLADVLETESGDLPKAKDTIEALKNLSKDGKLTVFEEKQESGKNICFGFGVVNAQVFPDDIDPKTGKPRQIPYLNMGFCSVLLNHRDDNCLFFDVQSTDVDMLVAKEDMQLNPHVYDSLRENTQKYCKEHKTGAAGGGNNEQPSNIPFPPTPSS